MWGELYPTERDAALKTHMALAEQQAQADRKMCDALASNTRQQNKTCILLDNPLDGWKIVQRMERQEAFLDALPAIIAALVAPIVLYRLWVKFGASVKGAAAFARRSLGDHCSNPIRLLQWILAFVSVAATTVVWKLL